MGYNGCEKVDRMVFFFKLVNHRWKMMGGISNYFFL